MINLNNLQYINENVQTSYLKYDHSIPGPLWDLPKLLVVGSYDDEDETELEGNAKFPTVEWALGNATTNKGLSLPVASVEEFYARCVGVGLYYQWSGGNDGTLFFPRRVNPTAAKPRFVEGEFYITQPIVTAGSPLSTGGVFGGTVEGIYVEPTSSLPEGSIKVAFKIACNAGSHLFVRNIYMYLLG